MPKDSASTQTKPAVDVRDGSTPKDAPLRRNFMWTAAGQAVYAVGQWVVIIVLAKIGGARSVGAFTLGVAIATPIVMFTNMQLRALQASDARSEFAFSDYVSLRIVTSAIALGLITLALILLSYPSHIATVVLVVGIAKCIESLSDVLYGYFQKLERFNDVALSLIIRSFVGLSAVVVAMSLTRNVLISASFLAGSWIVVLLLYDIHRTQELLQLQSLKRGVSVRTWLTFSKPRMKKLVKLAWPVGIVMLLVSLNVNIPRLLVERDLGVRQLGFFGALSYPVLLGNMAVLALGESSVPRLSRAFVANPTQFLRQWALLVVTAAAIGTTCTLLAIKWGPDLLRVLYGPSYGRFGTPFVWLMLSASFTYVGSASGYALTASRSLKIQVPIFLFTTATTLVGCLILVPTAGLTGAAQALTISSVLHATLACVSVAAAISKRNKMHSGPPHLGANAAASRPDTSDPAFRPLSPDG
jgi:O-antigen/teichoic acid export membrane protein